MYLAPLGAPRAQEIGRVVKILVDRQEGEGILGTYRGVGYLTYVKGRKSVVKDTGREAFTLVEARARAMGFTIMPRGSTLEYFAGTG